MVDQYTGRIIANKYRIASLLREGELGNVYRATHTAMEKVVTVKILSPALAVDESIVRRFTDEARRASRLSHRNILNVTDFGADADAVYIVYEGAEGDTLKDAIAADGRFSPERAADIASQIAAALAAAADAGITHGNLTSDKILLATSPNLSETVKVLDFGAAQTENGAALDEITGYNAEYLSPEQCSGANDVDTRSDIYSLGVIFYEMLAGEVPFTGANATEIMLKQVEEPPPLLSAFRHDLPPDIESVVLKAMAKNPDLRYQSAEEMSRDLSLARGLGGGRELAAVTAQSIEPANNIWKTAFIVLAGMSLLAVGLIFATSVKQTDPRTQIQTDANGLPVQPINPATGADEQSLSNMAAMPAELVGNSNSMPIPPGTIPGGDGYNPWGGSGPPAGAPPTGYAPPGYIPPGGTVITLDPNNPGSQFIPQDGGVILVPVPANTAVNANVKVVPVPKGASNANVSTTTPAANAAPKPATTPTPAAAPPKPAPTATDKPAPKQTPPPKNAAPAATEKRGQSGKEQDAL